MFRTCGKLAELFARTELPQGAVVRLRRWLPRSGVLAAAALSSSLLLSFGTAVYSRSEAEQSEPKQTERLPLPNGHGADLTEKACGTCHSVELFVGLRRTAPAWNDSVTLMIALGAPISDAQAPVIVRYLAEVFGPDSPPSVDASRAGIHQLKKLPGLDEAGIEAIVNYRKLNGEFTSTKQVRDLLGPKRFEKVKGYLWVRSKG